MTALDRQLIVDGEVIAALDAMKRPLEARNDVLRELLGLPEREKRPALPLEPLEIVARVRAGETLQEIADSVGLSRKAIEYRIRRDPEARAAYRVVREEERRLKELQLQERSRSLAANAGRHTLSTRLNADGRGARKRWAGDTLLDLVRRGAAQFGDPLSSLAFKNWLDSDPDLPSFRTFVIRFGPAWSDVCRAAGIRSVGGRPPSITAGACRAAVVRVAGAVGRPPSYEEYEREKQPGEPCGSSVRHHLGGGTWKAVLRDVFPGEAA